jgi:hypothetical protein
MTTATASAKILCTECRHENEHERIYCHECGTRLDRSAVQVKKEPVDDTRKRVKRMFNPRGVRTRAFCLQTIKLLIAAGITAGLVEIFLPPNVPPAKKDSLLMSSLRIDLESMAFKHFPIQKQISDEEANAFIASSVRSKKTSLDWPFLPFNRLFFAFHEKRCVITAERDVSGYWPVYTTCLCVPELKDGQLLARVEAAWIGRLPIHPKIAPYTVYLLADVRSALDRDIKLVSKLGGIEFHEKTAMLAAPVR